jgi:hypothetical protein
MVRTLVGARRGGAAAVAFVAALALLARAHASPPGKDASTSGYIKVPNTKDVHIFYWAFESRGNPDSDPLVLARAPARVRRLLRRRFAPPATPRDAAVCAVPRPARGVARATPPAARVA